MRPVTPELARARSIIASCLHHDDPHRPRSAIPARPPGPAREARGGRGEPGAARPDPGLGRPRAPLAAGRRRRTGPASAARRAQPGAARAVTHGDGPLLVVAGAGTGKTQVITRRIAWLIATRRARPSEILALTFTDKAADEMQVRVDQLVPYGYTDTAISTFHAFGDRLVREFALELGCRGRARALAARDGRLPARAPVRARAGRVPAAGRPDEVPRTPSRRCSRRGEGRGRLAGRLRSRTPTGCGRPRPSCAGGAADARPDAGGRRARGGGADAASWPAPMPRTSGCSPRTARSTSATRCRWRCGCCASRPRPASRSRPGSGTSSWTSSRTRTGPSRSSWPLVAAAASQRHRRRRRRPVDLQVPRRRDQQHPRVPGAVPEREGRRAAPQLPLAGRRSWTPPTGSSATTTRTGSRCGRASSSGWSPSAGPIGAPAVRHEAFATGAEEADWIAADIARRVRGGRARRDVAILVRANAAADPVLRSLNLEGIPWRFSGTSGLYARPEVRLPAVVPAGGRGSRRVRGRVRRSPRRTCTASGGEDLAAIVNMARRRNRSVFEVLEELGRQPGILRLSARDAGERRDRLVEDLRTYIALAHERPAGEVLYAFLRGSGWLKRLADDGDRRAPRRRCPTSPASSTSCAPSRRSSPTTGPCSSPATSRR